MTIGETLQVFNDKKYLGVEDWEIIEHIAQSKIAVGFSGLGIGSPGLARTYILKEAEAIALSLMPVERRVELSDLLIELQGARICKDLVLGIATPDKLMKEDFLGELDEMLMLAAHAPTLEVFRNHIRDIAVEAIAALRWTHYFAHKLSIVAVGDLELAVHQQNGRALRAACMALLYRHESMAHDGAACANEQAGMIGFLIHALGLDDRSIDEAVAVGKSYRAECGKTQEQLQREKLFWYKVGENGAGGLACLCIFHMEKRTNEGETIVYAEKYLPNVWDACLDCATEAAALAESGALHPLATNEIFTSPDYSQQQYDAKIVEYLQALGSNIQTGATVLSITVGGQVIRIKHFIMKIVESLATGEGDPKTLTNVDWHYDPSESH